MINIVNNVGVAQMLGHDFFWLLANEIVDGLQTASSKQFLYPLFTQFQYFFPTVSHGINNIKKTFWRVSIPNHIVGKETFKAYTFRCLIDRLNSIPKLTSLYFIMMAISLR